MLFLAPSVRPPTQERRIMVQAGRRHFVPAVLAAGSMGRLGTLAGPSNLQMAGIGS